MCLSVRLSSVVSSPSSDVSSRAMAQAVSHRPLTAKTSVRSQFSTVCSGSGTGFCPSTSALPYRCHFHRCSTPIRLTPTVADFRQRQRLSKDNLNILVFCLYLIEFRYEAPVHSREVPFFKSLLAERLAPVRQFIFFQSRHVTAG